MKMKKFIITLFAFVLVLSGCSNIVQPNTEYKILKFDKLTGIGKNDVKSILLLNGGDGSRIILSNEEDIISIMNELFELDFSETDETGMTIGNYSLILFKDDIKNQNIRISMAGSYAQFDNKIYTISKNKTKNEVDKFFEKVFEKKWNMPEGNKNVALEKLVDIDYNQIQKIILMEPKSGVTVEILALNEKDNLVSFLKSVVVTQKNSYTEKTIDWAVIKEKVINVSLIFDTNYPEKMVNFTFVGNELNLGSKFWYDIINDGFDINFFKSFSKYF